VAKEFKRIAFDPMKCRSEITELDALLGSTADLSERKDIQPFFRSHEQLSAFLGSYTAHIGAATDIVYEYPIFGNFAADLIVGNKSTGDFCFIEFEDGRDESIFKKTSRNITEWSPRFEHGFSQIVDGFRCWMILKKPIYSRKTLVRNSSVFQRF